MDKERVAASPPAANRSKQTAQSFVVLPRDQTTAAAGQAGRPRTHPAGADAPKHEQPEDLTIRRTRDGPTQGD
jgi:hypothetical protein